MQKKKKTLCPFLWIGFNCLKATVPVQRDRLFFTTKYSEGPGSHLINLRRMKDRVNIGGPQWFSNCVPWIGNPAPRRPQPNTYFQIFPIWTRHPSLKFLINTLQLSLKLSLIHQTSKTIKNAKDAKFNDSKTKNH